MNCELLGYIQPSTTWIILDVIGPIIIGLAVAYIAYRQWKTASDRVNLELYHKRYDVFKETLNILLKNSKQKINLEDASSYVMKMEEAKFLFERDVQSLLEEISVTLLRIADEEMSEHSPREYLAYPHPEGDSNWLMEIPSHVADPFLKYLDFRKLK